MHQQELFTATLTIILGHSFDVHMCVYSHDKLVALHSLLSGMAGDEDCLTEI